jgi:hypothetical protein
MKCLLDHRGRAIQNWKQLRVAIVDCQEHGALELILVHDAQTEEKWKECKPAPQKTAINAKKAQSTSAGAGAGEGAGGEEKEEKGSLPAAIDLLKGYQLLYALGEDGSPGAHPRTDQKCDFKITGKWLGEAAGTCDSRNESLFAHGYHMISKAQCEKMQGMVTAMLDALFELECQELENCFPDESVREQLEFGNRFLSNGDLEMDVTDTLTVENVPYAMNEKQLRAEFTKRGVEVEKIEFRDREATSAQLKKREVFVKLASAAMVEEAVTKMDKLMLKERKIRVAASDVQLKAAEHSPRKKRDGRSRRRDRGNGGQRNWAKLKNVTHAASALSGAGASSKPPTVPKASAGVGSGRASGGAGSGRASGGAGSSRASGGAGSGKASGGAGSGKASGGAGSGKASGGAGSGKASGGAGSGKVSGGAASKLKGSSSPRIPASSPRDQKGKAATQPKKEKGAGKGGGAGMKPKKGQGSGSKGGGTSR